MLELEQDAAILHVGLYVGHKAKAMAMIAVITMKATTIIMMRMTRMMAMMMAMTMATMYYDVHGDDVDDDDYVFRQQPQS